MLEPVQKADTVQIADIRNDDLERTRANVSSGSRM